MPYVKLYLSLLLLQDAFLPTMDEGVNLNEMLAALKDDGDYNAQFYSKTYY